MGITQRSMSRDGHRLCLGASDPDEVDPDLVAARKVHRRPNLYQRGEWVKDSYVERGSGWVYAEDIRTVAVELYLELRTVYRQSGKKKRAGDDSLQSNTDLRREIAELIGCKESTILYWTKDKGSST